MRVLFIFLIFLPLEIFGQQTQLWLDNLENPDYKPHELNSQNLLTEYMSYDFSHILIPKFEILGYIGENYQRIHVHFESIKRNNQVPNIYLVTGRTIVNKNECSFEGTVSITQVREFKDNFVPQEFVPEQGIKTRGLVIGHYLFNENPLQNHVGIFEGVMTMWWYLDKNELIRYDDIEIHSDNYKNNQYIGTWTEYGSYKSKVCNWGEMRIPFSGDLDWGVGEFSVNTKYLENGWQDYEVK